MSSVCSIKRASVVFSGRVQGVGFRFTAIAAAEGLSITGTIRNLWDGDVELIAEGTEQELLGLLHAIRRGRLGRYISGERLTWATATGEFEDFEIRYG